MVSFPGSLNQRSSLQHQFCSDADGSVITIILNPSCPLFFSKKINIKKSKFWKFFSCVQCMFYVLQMMKYRFMSLFCLQLSLVNGIPISYIAHVSWQKETMSVFVSRQNNL